MLIVETDIIHSVACLRREHVVTSKCPLTKSISFHWRHLVVGRREGGEKEESTQQWITRSDSANPPKAKAILSGISVDEWMFLMEFIFAHLCWRKTLGHWVILRRLMGMLPSKTLKSPSGYDKYCPRLHKTLLVESTPTSPKKYFPG